jgi:hypothetical protein
MFSPDLYSWCVNQKIQLARLFFVVTTSTSSFDLFCDKIRFLQPSIFVGEGLQACVSWGVSPADILSAIARSRCKQLVFFTVSEALCGDGICRCLFPLLSFSSVFFKLGWTTNN